MQIFLIMILSALIGGYYYFDSPSFKIEHEYSKTSVAVESEATCVAIQQQKAIDENIENLYENNFSFPQYYPCSEVYQMETKKYCIDPQGEITQDCFKQIPKEGQSPTTDCNQYPSRCAYQNSQYIITKTKKLEGATHSAMMNLLHKLSGGMPNIGLVFLSDNGEYMILTSNKSDHPIMIPPRIVGDFKLDPTQLIYLNYYDPDAVKALVDLKDRQESPPCEEGFIKTYSTLDMAFKCTPFNPAIKCFGDTVESADGECIPDEGKKNLKQCAGSEEVYFNISINAWDCRKKQILSCKIGETIEYNGQDFICSQNIDVGSIEGCNFVETTITGDKNTTRIRYDSNTVSICSSCEIPVYDRNACKMNCMPSKGYMTQTSCLSAYASLLPNWWSIANTAVPNIVNYNSEGGGTLGNCSEPSTGPVRNHNCIDYLMVYWNPDEKEWKIFDCFPLRARINHPDAQGNKGIISPYDTSLDGYGAQSDLSTSRYSTFWNSVLKHKVQGADPATRLGYFCDNGEINTAKTSPATICRRMGKSSPLYRYSLSQNRCYSIDENSPDYIGEGTGGLSEDDQQEIAKTKCPDGFVRAGASSVCTPQPNLNCSDGQLAVRSSTSSNMYCWSAPSIFYKSEDVMQGYAINVKGIYATINSETWEGSGVNDISLTFYQTNEGGASCYGGTTYNNTANCKGLLSRSAIGESQSEVSFCEEENGKCKDISVYNGCPAGTIRVSDNAIVTDWNALSKTQKANSVCAIQWHSNPCPYEDYKSGNEMP
ncbi:MAG: hypothetical protein LBR35_01240, partial [Rickettsiales bacterium]|nr:hypothetical protein [Rickettsiales bacterium]